MSFGLVFPFFFSFFNNIFFMLWQMIVVTSGVSLAEMLSSIVMPIRKKFIIIKKKHIERFVIKE